MTARVPRRDAVLQALLRLGAGADAEGIAEAFERYIHGLMRRTGVRSWSQRGRTTAPRRRGAVRRPFLKG